MKKITKKQNKDFVKECIEVLNEYNVQKGSSYYSYGEYTYSIKNEYFGELSIRIDDDNSVCYTIFTRFENPKIAKKHFNCNPYSGKHNCHSYDRDEPIYFLDSLLNSFNTICEREMKVF